MRDPVRAPGDICFGAVCLVVHATQQCISASETDVIVLGALGLQILSA